MDDKLKTPLDLEFEGLATFRKQTPSNYQFHLLTKIFIEKRRQGKIMKNHNFF